VAAVTMVLTLFTLASLVDLARDNTIRSLRGNGSLVKRWGGVILMVVGAWLLVLALWNETLLSL
jgi:hypothetical protein